MKEYRFRINGKDYAVEVGDRSSSAVSVSVNGVQYSVEMQKASPIAAAGKVQGGAKTVNAPLPGVIIGIDVKEGQRVRRGDRIAVLEAMKMENDILCEREGTVCRIFTKVGESLLEGDKIAEIE